MKIREALDKLDEINRRDFLKGAGAAVVGGIISPPTKAEANWIKYDTTHFFNRYDKTARFKWREIQVSPEESGGHTFTREFYYDSNSVQKLSNGNFNIWIRTYQYPTKPMNGMPYSFRLITQILYEINPTEYSLKDKWYILWQSDDKNHDKLDWITKMNETGDNKWSVRGPDDPLWKVIRNFESRKR